MSAGLLVSILINNYNYERFLADAIDSALNQTHPWIEVIVVDDGSSDGSHSIIERYGNRIAAILKPNGGQASAFNVGFERSQGDVVIFLDADDVLLPNTAQRMADLFQSRAEVTKIQYRMAVIDAQGRATGQMVPPSYVRMPNGDLRRNLAGVNNHGGWSPTSGNAFAAWFLRRLFPIPEHVYRGGNDAYLSEASALAGPIVSLDEPGAQYRIHGFNESSAFPRSLSEIHATIERTCDGAAYLKAFADSLGIVGYPATATRSLNIIFVCKRMISLKMDPAHHPISADTVAALLWLGIRSALQRPDVSWRVRIMEVGWLAAMAVSPRPLARRLGVIFMYSDKRGALNYLLGRLPPGARRIPFGTGGGANPASAQRTSGRS